MPGMMARAFAPADSEAEGETAKEPIPFGKVPIQLESLPQRKGARHYLLSFSDFYTHARATHTKITFVGKNFYFLLFVLFCLRLEWKPSFYALS